MTKTFLGAELDWFAIDDVGAIALLATAGAGFVTEAVNVFRVMHETVANSIEYPNWGSEAIWEDAAKLGLYVFDWQMPDGPYVRVASPSAEIDTQIQLMVSRITELPKFAGRFSQTPAIASPDDFD